MKSTMLKLTADAVAAVAAGAALITLAIASMPAAHAETKPLAELKLDFAYYSPESLVIKHNCWLEQAFKPQGTAVTWAFSRGSNNSLEFLNSGASNFALTSKQVDRISLPAHA